MSHDANKWEADIRRAVETHEFDYDPQAWAAMEGLLDGATALPAGAGGKALLWKIGLPLLLVAAAGLAWWFWPAREAVVPPPGKEEVLPPDTVQTQGAHPEEEDLSLTLPQRAPSLPTRKRVTAPPLLPGREIRPSLPPPPLEVVRDRMEAALPLPARPIPFLASPDTLRPDLELIPPEPGRRRRDRKTLYPDVIEKY